MRLCPIKPMKRAFSYALLLKLGSICLLFALCLVAVACGNSGSPANLNNNPATTAIVFGNDGSPTPSLPEYLCGAWATQTSPPADQMVMVYAKFVQNVNGNPVGVGGATATATTHWWDGSVTTQTVETTSDGLAVFSIPPKANAVGTLTLVDVTFSKPGTPGCTVPQAAYFTLMVPTATASATSAPTASPTATETVTPTITTPPDLSPTATTTATPNPSDPGRKHP
jgi:hypothetical protein